MAELIVSVEKVKDVIEHPNADRLDIIQVKGWYCIVGKNSLKKNDLVVYFPIDSILPPELENILFPEDSKIKLNGKKIKTIKLRGSFSQGLAVPVDALESHYPDINFGVGKNVTKDLGVKKWEFKEKRSMRMNTRQRSKKEHNPNFHKYTNINHLKNYPNVLNEEAVVITEKVHGTNFRSGYVPIFSENVIKGFWKLLKQYISKNQKYPGFEFVVGSHNVQLKSKNPIFSLFDLKHLIQSKKYTHFGRKKNVYQEISERYKLSEILGKNEVVYGEIYGEGIQKKYNYGLEDIDLVVFDAKVDGEYLNYSDLMRFCIDKNLPSVPELFIGTYNEEKNDLYAVGNSVLYPEQKVREGIVIKRYFEKNDHVGRNIFKLINPEYLLMKGNSEFH